VPQGPCEFDELNLPDPVIRGIRDAGFLKMTPIQKKALPMVLAGGDLAGQAQTGTGKTATFLIALFAKLVEQVGRKERAPLALILAPTRELALQIFREAKLLATHTGLRQVAIYGGEGFTHQENKLRDGVDVVVGTPGRLLDFARRRVLDLSRIEFLVIDEADRLLDMGFWEELRKILQLLPHPSKRQSMLFSATLDSRVHRIASGYMNEPVDVKIKPESITAEGIDQKVYHVEAPMKFRLLLGILQKEEVPKGLIFANMKITAAWVAKKLQQHGFEVTLLTGDLRQTVRNRVLEKFQSGEIPLLVASDVASRGLHIDDVTHIINFDVPQDPEDYVHRIGRTARAGKKGKAYTLACDEYCIYLPDIEKLLTEPIPSIVPYDDDYGEDMTPDFTRRKMSDMERRRKSESRNSRGGPGGRGGRSGGYKGGPRKSGPYKGGQKRSGPPRGGSKPRGPKK
jgi:ATP-dependent RNA helicase RhlB